MNPFGSKKNLTKKGCMVNGLTALVCTGLLAVSSVLGSPEAKTTKNLVMAAGLLFAVTVYWFWRYWKFNETESEDSGNK